MNAKAVCLITGGASGVGFALAKDLARAGHSVIILSRSKSRGKEAVERIKKKAEHCDVTFLMLDLDHFDSIKTLSAQLKAKGKKIALLAHCAAVLSFREKSKAVQMLRTNVIGPYQLTKHLLQAQLFEEKAKVIVTAGSPGLLKLATKDVSQWLSLKSQSVFSSYLQTITYRACVFLQLKTTEEFRNLDIAVFHPGLVKSKLLLNGPWYLRTLLAMINLFLPSRTATGYYLTSQKVLLANVSVIYVNKKPVRFEHLLLEKNIMSQIGSVTIMNKKGD